MASIAESAPSFNQTNESRPAGRGLPGHPLTIEEKVIGRLLRHPSLHRTPFEPALLQSRIDKDGQGAWGRPL